jgi:hypothetical protein
MTPPDTRRRAVAWQAPVVRALAATRRVTNTPGSSVDLRRCEAAAAGLERELARAGADVRLEDGLAWKLLALRDVLVSHLVAVRALADVAGDHGSVGPMLRRGVDEVASGFARLVESDTPPD